MWKKSIVDYKACVCGGLLYDFYVCSETGSKLVGEWVSE